MSNPLSTRDSDNDCSPLYVRTVDEIISEVTSAPSRNAALRYMASVPRSMVLTVADQLYVEPYGRTDRLRAECVDEARQ
jgi:hypothetical protein